MSLTDSIDVDSKSEKPMSLIWGCELSSERDSYTFQVPDEWQYEQQLALRTICLGEKARDEFHVVEIVPAEDGEAPRAPVPLATLKPSVLVELASPTVMPNLSWDEEEEAAEEEESAEESPEKPPKAQAAKKGSVAKRRLEKDEELNSVSSEDPLPSKGRGAGRGKKPAAKK
nr:PREDICTED: nucleoplasmin-2 [Struthio camelus australis]